MKNFISLIVAVLCFLQLSAQEHYYYYKGEKQYLELNTDYIFISALNKSSIQNVRIGTSSNLNKSSKLIEDKPTKATLQPTGLLVQHPVRYSQEINLTNNFSKANYLQHIAQLKVNNNNLIIAPCFKDKAGNKVGLSNYFHVKLKHRDDFDKLLEQIEIHHVELIGYNEFMPLWFKLSVTPNTPNAMQMASLFYETGLFQYTEPEMRVPTKTNSAAATYMPDDPYYEEQWHLKNTENPGIDINVEGAWDITLGDNIIVAVIDGGIQRFKEGFLSGHPDLENNIVGTGYDTNSAGEARLKGPHGTACAGIIAAEGNNEIGISGVAPRSSLMSISRGRSLSDHADCRTYTEHANGINWAWQNGADIISNSWYDPTPHAPCSHILDDAFDNALANGRGGLGTVIVFAIGNGNIEGADKPGDGNPLILCVGGIDKCGIRSGAVAGSCDPWSEGGSNYGSYLDVVAGGTNVLTTDRTGDEGYTPLNPYVNHHPDTDYTYFTGTSAAAPQVAGVAALILSANPNLTVQEVNDIIEQSAQKINSGPDLYTYENNPDRPNGLWNEELGYGLVDAHKAVLMALDCEADLTLSGTINSDHYEAGSTIIATGEIGANQSVTFDARGYIELNNLFDANSNNGSTFLAYIEGCLPDANNAFTNNDNTDEGYKMEDEANTTSSEIMINNSPNPFTGNTTIAFTLFKDSPVTLFVSDATGRKVAILLDNKVKSEGIIIPQECITTPFRQENISVRKKWF